MLTDGKGKRANMQDNLTISVSREYGSGGREIAERLAEELGIAYYDKMLLARIARESGLSDDVIEAHDEKPIDRFLFSPNRFLSGTDTNLPIASEIYRTEIALIKSIADEGTCVIVGRCADSILAERTGLVSLFISAPLPNRIDRVMRRNNLDETAAKNRIVKTDKARANYHDYFSNRDWGTANFYDLCINSGRLNADGAVEVIKQYLHARA